MGETFARGTEKVRERNQKKIHVQLTARDIQILEALHKHVVLSFMQIHERYFPGRTIVTSTNRLKRLERQRWIERIRVPRLTIYGRRNATNVVYQLTTLGRRMLTKCRLDLHVFEKCPSLNLHQLDHDILIADIAPYFERQYPSCRWLNGRYLSANDGINKIPDAVLRLPDSSKVIGVELELTGKSAARYREIVAHLKTSARLDSVIFVTANTSIGRKIMSAIEGFQVPVGHSLTDGFFKFVGLSSCLKDQTKGP